MSDVASFINESKRRKDIGKTLIYDIVKLSLKQLFLSKLLLILTSYVLTFLVDKYKSEEERTLTQKISKLNLHSIGKKSTRIGTKFLSSIGIDPVVTK